MATMNIAGLTPVDDPSYRYKMPKIMCKVEGKGNGIKTVLSNVGEIGLALNREAPEVAKFFGCEIGSQTSTSEGRHIVNGSHTAQALQGHLSKYIEKFVLCFNCHLPETHYKIKSGIIAQKCLACGHKENVDMTHKLTTFILGQHKKQKELDKKNGVTSADKKEKKKKDKAAKDASAEGDDDDDDAPDATAAAATVEPATEKKEKKKKDKSASSSSLDSSEENATAGNDTTNGLTHNTNSFSSNQAADDKTLTDLKSNGELDTEEVEIEGDLPAVEESITRFRGWFHNPENASKSKDAVMEELRTLQTFQSLHAKYRSTIFMGAVIFSNAATANANIDASGTPTASLTAKELSAKIIQYKEYLIALGTTTANQRHLIAGLEYFCGVKYRSFNSNGFIKFFPILLKVVFDEELVEEEAILAWSKDLLRNEFSCDDSMVQLDTLEELREVAQPFIVWLQEAEEEEDEDDDDEDQEED